MLIIIGSNVRRISITKILLLNFILVFLPLFESIAYGHHPHDPVAALAVSPEYHEDKTVFLAIGAKLKKSVNGGASWEKLVRGIETNQPYTFLAISPSYGEDNTIFLGTSEGAIYKSVDRGSSWALVSRQRVQGGVRLDPPERRAGGLRNQQRDLELRCAVERGRQRAVLHAGRRS